MTSSVTAYLERQRWQPGILGIFLNPFYLARKGLFHAMRDLGGQIRGETLDIGCGQKPYASLFRTTSYIGLELDTPENRVTKQADAFYDGEKFPFEDGRFQSVVCNQVLEHVFHPDRFLAEIHRVLGDGGILLLTVPFVWDEHEQPYDFGRYSTFGVRDLLERHGFTVVSQHRTLADARVLFQLGNAYLFKVTRTGNRYLNAALTVVLMAPVNLMGIVAGKVLPGNPDFYLDNVVLARKGG